MPSLGDDLIKAMREAVAHARGEMELRETRVLVRSGRLPLFLGPRLIRTRRFGKMRSFRWDRIRLFRRVR